MLCGRVSCNITIIIIEKRLGYITKLKSTMAIIASKQLLVSVKFIYLFVGVQLNVCTSTSMNTTFFGCTHLWPLLFLFTNKKSETKIEPFQISIFQTKTTNTVLYVPIMIKCVCGMCS